MINKNFVNVRKVKKRLNGNNGYFIEGNWITKIF